MNVKWNSEWSKVMSKRDICTRMKLPVIRCFISLLCMILSFSASAHEQIPAAPQKQPIALVGGTIHTVSGPVI